jgi:adenosine deaminase
MKLLILIFSVASLSFTSVYTQECALKNEAVMFRNIPKAELHLHLGGSYPLEYLISIATSDQQRELHSRLDALSNRVDYHESFKVFDTIGQIVNTENKVERGAEALCQWLEQDNVVYAEIRTGLRDLGHGHEEYLKAVLRGLEKGASDHLKVRLLLSLRRSSSLELAKNTIDLALKYRSHGIVGIDVSGDSTIGEIEVIMPEIRRAREQGLFLTLHIGESPKEKKQRELLETLQPHRIGHGVFLESDALQWILDNRIPMEVCLTSSVLVQMTKEYALHPGLNYYSQGHPIAICTDDPLIFRIDLSTEFARLFQTPGMSFEKIDQLARASLDQAFLTDKEKDDLRKNIAARNFFTIP